MSQLSAKTRCHLRSLGHSWEEYEPLDPPQVAFGVPVSFRCVNGCGTVKHEILNRFTGERNGHTRYVYEDDYRFPAGTPSQDELRKAMLAELGL